MRGTRPLLFKCVESVFAKAQELAPVDVEVMRVHYRFVDRFRQEPPPHVFLERRAIGPNEAALPDNRLDDALAFELGVCLRDGIAVHAQFLGQRPNGRQGLAGLQRAGRGRKLYLIDQLQVDGFARLEIELEQHVTVLGQYDNLSFRLSSAAPFSIGGPNALEERRAFVRTLPLRAPLGRRLRVRPMAIAMPTAPPADDRMRLSTSICCT